MRVQAVMKSTPMWKRVLQIGRTRDAVPLTVSENSAGALRNTDRCYSLKSRNRSAMTHNVPTTISPNSIGVKSGIHLG
jgi:hypothetical protein